MDKYPLLQNLTFFRVSCRPSTKKAGSFYHGKPGFPKNTLKKAGVLSRGYGKFAHQTPTEQFGRCAQPPWRSPSAVPAWLPDGARKGRGPGETRFSERRKRDFAVLGAVGSSFLCFERGDVLLLAHRIWLKSIWAGLVEPLYLRWWCGCL